MTPDTQEKLSPITISLHWIVGLTIITLLGVGLYMSNTHAYSLYPIHKSVGVCIFAVILLRVIWRIKNGWPQPAGQYKKIEQLVSKVVHYTLLIGSVIIPVSGMMMSGLGGHGIHVFGLELMARNVDPNDMSKVIPINGDLAGLGSNLHEYVSYLVIGAIILHVAGAYKHHIINKDGTLKRMLGAKISLK